MQNVIEYSPRSNPMEPLRQSLVKSIARWIGEKDVYCTSIACLRFYRSVAPTAEQPCLVDPNFALVVQGAKRMAQGSETYDYNPQRFLITSLDLPVTLQVIDASPEKPYLGLGLKLDFRVLAELMVQIPPQQPTSPTDRGIVTGQMTLALYDATRRLLDLLDDPESIPVLAPSILREIYYRLLMSDQGARLRQIASVGSHGHRIFKAIEWLLAHYDKPLRVEELAARAQMSSSTFHHHFRHLTAMSPLQYQKSIRLSEARRIMLSEHLDAASASFKVGYESPTQFSREYRRLFGTSPRRDVDTLRQQRQLNGPCVDFSLAPPRRVVEER